MEKREKNWYNKIAKKLYTIPKRLQKNSIVALAESDIRYYKTKEKSKIMWYVIQVISGNWTMKKHMEKKHAEKYNNI